jgi:hypothetical protein
MQRQDVLAQYDGPQDLDSLWLTRLKPDPG